MSIYENRKDFQIDNKIIGIINAYPDNFHIVAADGGYFGGLVYRTIVGSSDSYVWNDKINGIKDERLDPLEWPKNTEGFPIYLANNFSNYSNFKEQHLSTAHIGIPLLENMTPQELAQLSDFKKTLLCRTHNIEAYKKCKTKIVRIFGNLHSLYPEEKYPYRQVTKEWVYKPVNQKNVLNLEISKFLSDDYEIFLEQYLSLIHFLNLSPNINNVRAFILLLKDKLKRFHESQP